MRKTLATLTALLMSSSALAFSDVSSANPHKDAIDYLEQHAVVSGFPDGQFKSGQGITRAELAKIVVGARGENPSPRSFNSCFPDVANEWFAPFVCFAEDENWLDGYLDGTFKPGGQVNRAEAAKIILNALGIALDDSVRFSDFDSDAWFAPYANTIHTRNVLDDTNFFAERRITRGEVAEMIYRILAIKHSGEAAFDSTLASTFDSDTSPAEIVARSIDFSNSANANFELTTWRIENGVWTIKPTLRFNGGDFFFDTPAAYVTVLKTIQRHFETLDLDFFTNDFTRFISEFEAVAKSYTDFDSSTSILPSGANSSLGVGANFTNLDLARESVVAARGSSFAEFGNTKIYIGYEVLAPLNYNPVVVSFTSGEQDWVRRDYETSSDESLAYGILQADADTVFVVFSSRGIEENINSDFRRFAKNGWLSEYGEGSGNQIAVIAKIDPTDGDILAATFLSARLPDGDTNSLNVTGLEMNGENLVVSAEAWDSPRRINGQPMDLYPNAGNPPFAYEIEFTPDLQTAVRASAPDFGQ